MRSTAERGRLELQPGLWADARRAVFLEAESTLALADPHLGYAWAHRASGNLLPLGVADGWEQDLTTLLEDYAPRQVLVLGDFVHRAVALAGIKKEICRFLEIVETRSRLILISGNHDHGLRAVLDACGREVELADAVTCGGYRMMHGHEDCAGDERVVMGHEHPVISLSDQAGGRLKCPCFLVGERTLVLPATSRWAAGSSVWRASYLSRRAQRETFGRAIAILGDRLLPVALGERTG